MNIRAKLRPRSPPGTRAGGIAAEVAILLGPYELLERINVGGMAEIVKARALEVTDQPLVALKRILPHLSDDAQFVTMFLDESRMLSRLHHPHIIHTLDVGTFDGVPYLALEYVNGKDARMLFHRCRRAGVQVPIPLSCYVIAAALDGLQCAHDHTDNEGKLLNLVHRDVSLQNILLSFDGDVKITDFGIARSADNEARTEAGIVKGKFGYMSPEQIRSQPLDRRSDVFAAGICLYELLTGERLFSGDNDYAAVERVRSVSIDPPSALNGAIPAALERVVMKALSKHPKDRFQSAGEMRDALQRFLAKAGQSPTAADLGSFLRQLFLEGAGSVELGVDDDEDEDGEGDHSTNARIESIAPGALAADEPPVAAPAIRVPPLVPSAESIPPAYRERKADPFAALAGPEASPDDEDEVEVTRRVPSPVAPKPEPATQTLPSPSAPPSNPKTPATAMSHYSPAAPAMAQDAFAEPLPTRHPIGPWIVRGVDVRIPLTLFAFAVVMLFAIGAMVDQSVDTGTIQLVVSPPDAAVEIDGRAVDVSQSPFVLSDLEADVPHVLRVHKDGFREWTARMTVDPGEVVQVPPIALMQD